MTGIPCSSKEALIAALEAGVEVDDRSSPFYLKRYSIGESHRADREGMKQY